MIDIILLQVYKHYKPFLFLLSQFKNETGASSFSASCLRIDAFVSRSCKIVKINIVISIISILTVCIKYKTFAYIK